MKLPLILVAAFAIGAAGVSDRVVNAPLWCGACQGLMDEIEWEISQGTDMLTLLISHCTSSPEEAD